MLLALLLVLRGDLLDRWQQQLPPESPNYFLINIATEQVAPLKAFLAEHQIVPESFYPVVRARLTAINDKPTEGNEDEALNRELNLTWQNTRPDHNPIVAGNWPPKADEVSMEEGLAKRLNVALGDTVTFMGDTQEFRAKSDSACAKWTGKVCGLISILFSLKGHYTGTAELAYQFPLGEWQRHVDTTQPPVPDH